MEPTRENIATMLEQRNANKPCSRCGNENFSILEKYSHVFLQETVNDIKLGGIPTIPVAVIGCDNCGAITFHALGPLGLLKGGE